LVQSVEVGAVPGVRKKLNKRWLMLAALAIILMGSVVMVYFGSQGRKLLLLVEDPSGDDYGPGTYTYPVDYTFRLENFGKRETFDVVQFAIYDEGESLAFEYKLSQPIVDPWSEDQTKLYDISLQAVDIYIDNGSPGGNTETIFDRTVPGNLEKNPNGAINAVIEDESAWEYAIRAHGWDVNVFKTPTGENNNKMDVGSVAVDKEKGIITVRVPKFAVGSPTPDWRVTTFMFSVDYGNARVVDAHASSWHFGGGREDNSDPNIIDLIVPPGQTQEEILDFETSSPVVLSGIPLGSGTYASEKGTVSVSVESTAFDVSDIPPIDNVLDEIVRRGVLYFWEMADENTGLVRDTTKYPNDEFPASTAATGFGLTALVIGAERGWLDNDAVYERVLTTLNSFYDNTAENENDLVVDGENGFFYHFIRMSTGERWEPAKLGKPGESSEISTIDTALLLAGALTAGEYYKGTDVENLAKEIYEHVDWSWMLAEDNTLYHGWTPERGYLANRWEYYSEAMVLYLLAVGSPTHPIPPESWDAWERPLTKIGTTSMYIMSPPESLFTYQYSHAWVDFRDKHDHYADYFQNSINATHNNRNFVIWVVINSPSDKYLAFDDDVWGLTAGDAPCAKTGYKNYGAHLGGYDGTIHPYGMVASMPFVPELSKSGIENGLLSRYGREIWREYGFTSGFNPDVDWYSHDYTGIDVGIQVLMVQNYLDNFVWDTFMKNEYVQRAMDLVGFENGPLENNRAVTPEYENEYLTPTETPEATAVRAPASVAINGIIPEWNDAKWYEVSASDVVLGSIRTDIENVCGRFSAMWDETNLYLVADVTDTILVSNIEPDDLHSFYRTDSIEFYLQPDRFIPDAEGIFKIAAIPFDTDGNPQGVRHEDMNPGPISSVAPDVQIASSKTSTGYIIEIAIPWKYLNIDPDSGDKLGFTFTIHNTYFTDAEPGEYVRTGMLSWTPVPVVWARPSTWGILMLE